MIRFAHPYLLNLLWLLLPLALWLLTDFNRRHRWLRSLQNQPVLIPGYSRSRRLWGILLRLSALASLLIALAQPQVGTRLEEITREGVDILIAIDVSQSMAAEDITPSRLAKARHATRSFIGRLRGDRVGLIPFAGLPYSLFPLTLDYGAAAMFVDVLDVGFIPLPGTELAPVISRAVEMFDATAEASRVLVVLTDGEDFGEGLEEALQLARQAGVTIYTVGIGTLQGAPIPIYDEAGERTGYRQDQEGNIILTRLNEAVLSRLAQETDGQYYLVTPGEAELTEIYHEIYQLEQSELTSQIYTRYEERFQWFLMLGLAILWLEMILPASRRREQ
ncbi:MAG: VWA domain-containing protein [Candidatus Delongbacteria bacterium]|nr:VWA domain-containing protein [Candidatus Delongbacteria bacterium]